MSVCMCWPVCTYQLVCLSVSHPLHSSCTYMSVCMCWPVCTYHLVCLSVCLTPTAFLMHVYVCVHVLASLYVSIGLSSVSAFLMHVSTVCVPSSFFFMHLYVSALASLCAPIRLCVCVSRLIHVYVCVVVSLYVSIGLSVCLSVSPPLHSSCTCMFVCWSLCTYHLVCFSVCPIFVSRLMHVYVCMLVTLYISTGLSVCLSVTRPLHSSRTCMSVWLSVCTRRYVIRARVPGTTRRWVTNASWRPTMSVPFMTSPRPTNGSASCSQVSLDTC